MICEISPNPPSNQCDCLCSYHQHLINQPYSNAGFPVFARARIHHPRRGFTLAATPWPCDRYS